MVAKPKITAQAEDDLTDAMLWYENQKMGLGLDFLEEFERALEIICIRPKSIALKYKSIRRINLHKFPFSLFYTFEENQNLVVVWAVLHQSRNPRTWEQRLN